MISPKSCVTRRTAYAAFLVLAVLGLVTWIFWPALDAPFYLDDEDNIETARGIHMTEISTASVHRLRTDVLLPSRLVANASFAMNFMAAGLSPRIFRLTNVFLHFCAGGAIYWVAMLIGVRPKPMPNMVLAASITTALLFLVHPLNTQPVIYIVQRMTLLAALFTVISFGCYLKFRRHGFTAAGGWWLALGTITWLFGVGSKEVAWALPGLVLLAEFSFHRNDLLNLVQNPRRIPLAVWIGLGAVSSAILLLLAFWFWQGFAPWPPFRLFETFAKRDFNGIERILTQTRVQLFYVGLLLWPAANRLSLDHDFSVSRGLFDPPTTLGSLILLIGLVVIALWFSKKKPGLTFPVLAYLLLHLIESGPVNLELVFEHRMYLPLAFLLLGVGPLVNELQPKYAKAALVLMILMAFPLAWASRARASVWASPDTFYADTAAKANTKFRPQYNLATHLIKQAKFEQALAPLTRAVELNPDSAEAQSQIGTLLDQLGHTDKAVPHLERAVELDPNACLGVYNLARVLEKVGRNNEAAQHFQHFLYIAPPSQYQHLRTTAQVHFNRLSQRKPTP